MSTRDFRFPWARGPWQLDNPDPLLVAASEEVLVGGEEGAGGGPLPSSPAWE